MNRHVAFFDGGSRRRKNIGAGGAVLYEGDQEIAAAGVLITDPEQTTNTCEYAGLLLAIKLAKDAGVEDLVVYGDSEVVVRQVDGRYQARKRHLKALRDEVWREARSFKSIQIRETPKGKKGKRRDNNQRADSLCNEAMDGRMSIHYNEKELLIMETEPRQELMEEPTSEERGFAESPETPAADPAPAPVDPETPETPADEPAPDNPGTEQPAPAEVPDAEPSDAPPAGDTPSTEE